MDKNFLLETNTARNLFDAVKNEPIFDYHCHLSPAQIAENIKQGNLAQAWLSGDHYKWRVMRVMGINEHFITGGAPDYEKYMAWAKTTEDLIGNPLYHWTHLELQRYFNIYEPLTEKSAPAIWENANALLQKPELSAKGIFEKFNVHTVGTTDDPIDNLEHHRAIADGIAPIGKIKTRIIPTFRPDKALDLNAEGFENYIDKLSQASDLSIKTTDDVINALEKRLDYFISLGCRSSDHSFEYAPFSVISQRQMEKIFKMALSGKPVSKEDADAYKTKILIFLAHLYSERGITMQIHLSVMRNINTKYFSHIGSNTGYDVVNDLLRGQNLATLLDVIESNMPEPGLPKTILYSLNPNFYYPITAIMGSFQNSNIKGKMQLGSAWWFCDHKDGIEEQMRTLANLGMLSAFVGMLTDSRSFLSYPRHEYFRRILCNIIGKWAENGEYPMDIPKLEKIVKDISFGNAVEYFG